MITRTVMFISSQFFVDLSFSYLRDFEVLIATCDLISNFSTLISLDVLYNEMKIFESGLIKRR